MNIPELRGELEAEMAWRQDEIRFFQNQGADLDDEDRQEQYRRALILVLYAHFEGFCKFALTLYVNTVNREGIKCAQANHAIAAASLADVFMALRDRSAKCADFRNAAPDDTKLHRFARDREFVERTADFLQRTVSIPDDVVDTESNLKPVVLRKNLFRLGLPHDLFATFEDGINQLLAYRNRIAHGESRLGITEATYESVRESVFTIIEAITVQVMTAVANKQYLKTP
jgi:hypothetical protein